MNKVVVKFGGSNLKTKEDISKLLRVIHLYSKPVIIVISALYGVTNLLVNAVRDVMNNGQAISQLKKKLIDIHEQILCMNIDDPAFRDETLQKIKKRINELSKYLLGVHCLGELPDFAEDMVLSYGERLSSLVLESVLTAKNIHCAEMLPETMGFITDGEHGNATVDLKASEEQVRKCLTGDKIYIIPGFYGISYDAKVTLLGRGGSDYTAAAVARCIGAASVDIWKDVPGFMTADPKFVEHPTVIEKLTYREAAELSYFGAQILHPRTFEPLLDRNIPIRLFDITNISDELKPLTTIERKGVVRHDVVKSVTFSDDFGILKLRGVGVGIKPGIMARVTACLNEARINIKSIITAQTSINILLSRSETKTGYDLVSTLGLSAVEEVVYMDTISLIAVVGEGLLEKPGIAARIFSAVSREKINVLILSAGASNVATYFIIDKNDRTRAIHAIHKEFFNENH